jgi:hypothetical protein
MNTGRSISFISSRQVNDRLFNHSVHLSRCAATADADRATSSTPPSDVPTPDSKDNGRYQRLKANLRPLDVCCQVHAHSSLMRP